jgi:hypothetical protein
MATTAVAVPPSASANDPSDENGIEQQEQQGVEAVPAAADQSPAAKRQRTGADAHAAGGDTEAAPSSDAADHKGKHGHHGHLRTHHTVDEPEEDGAPAPSTSGDPAAADRARDGEAAHAAKRHKAAGGGAVSPWDWFLGCVLFNAQPHPIWSTTDHATPPTTHIVRSHAQAKLSFVDELEAEQQDDDGEGKGGNKPTGGLHAATAERFKQEKRSARQQQQQHAFHRRSGADTHGSDSGSPRAAAVAVVDDDAADGPGTGRGGAAAAAPTLGRIHFGAASARGMRPYMEDRHCIVAAMQLLASAEGGGAHAGPPLPPDGVPRSYAAIFDGELRRRPRLYAARPGLSETVD